MFVDHDKSVFLLLEHSEAVEILGTNVCLLKI